MNRTVIYTQPEAQARCHVIQVTLGLTEWEITVHIVRQRDFTNKSANDELLGQCVMHDFKQIALIRLLDPIDFAPLDGIAQQQNHELTLIHELLHVRLNGISADSRDVRELCEERAVHALSVAFEELLHAR